MGNAFGCSASGERLVSAARDGDLVEAKMLLQLNPALARYSTFGSLNSPLHFASAKGHNEIAALLLENGADVNSRNYCGHTPLMHACRHGHWEVVQTLLLFRSTTMKADYLSSRTALHFAAVNGHARCIRLLLADFVPSVPYEEAITSAMNSDRNDGSSRKSALSKFVNKVADGGVTALHMAALNGFSDCVQLLLDIHANVSAVTFHYGTWKDLIGAGSTPLHYAAYGGNLKCCQMLLARGASRLTLNYNGWLPLDVARVWGRRRLEPWLDPNSRLTVPAFSPSKYLSLPLMSIVNIARESGLESSTGSADDVDICAVCLERACSVAAEGCRHGLCVKCALYLCSTSNIASEIGCPPGSIPCPLCRCGIISFIKLWGSQEEELKQSMGLGLCTPCMLHAPNLDPPVMTLPCSIRRNRVASVSSDLLCPVSCSSFPSLTIPPCTCNHSRCPSLEHQDGETQDQSHLPQSIQGEQDKVDVLSIEKTSCSSTSWNRRSNHKEQQCKCEINV